MFCLIMYISLRLSTTSHFPPNAQKRAVFYFRVCWVPCVWRALMTDCMDVMSSLGRRTRCEGHAWGWHSGAVPGQTLGHQTGHQRCHHSTEGRPGVYKNTRDTQIIRNGRKDGIFCVLCYFYLLKKSITLVTTSSQGPHKKWEKTHYEQFKLTFSFNRIWFSCLM